MHCSRSECELPWNHHEHLLDVHNYVQIHVPLGLGATCCCLLRPQRGAERAVPEEGHQAEQRERVPGGVQGRPERHLPAHGELTIGRQTAADQG